MKKLEGWKTYIVAAVTLIYALSGLALKQHDVETAVTLISIAL